MARAAALALILALAIGGAAVGGAAAAEGAISLSGVTVSVLEASGSVADKHSVTGPDARLRLSLDHTRTLKVQLTAALAGGDDDFRPQQAFLRLTVRGSGDAAYFAATKAKGGGLVVTAKHDELQKQVGTQPGTYDAALLVGDSRSAQPVDWSLGEVKVLYAPQDDGSQPEAKPYRTLDATFRPKPEILHQHRQPERRAPAVVSLFFSLLALAPLAAYVVMALSLGANLKGFPSGAAFLPAAAFHAGLAAICALYLLFWLQLNLMQASRRCCGSCYHPC
jgi:oligosaccharyltransferase complex subunit delta (ribophorin II)